MVHKDDPRILTAASELPRGAYCASVNVLSTRKDGYGGTMSVAIAPRPRYMRYRCPLPHATSLDYYKQFQRL